MITKKEFQEAFSKQTSERLIYTIEERKDNNSVVQMYMVAPQDLDKLYERVKDYTLLTDTTYPSFRIVG